jgi:ferredoxin-NADP reductase
LIWLTATVRSMMDETPSVRTLELDVPGWPGHMAGQHLDVRLTADDGYQAERGYSIASAPGEGVAITVERLDDGEVSPYLTEEIRPGDMFEVRGPIGQYFIWEPAMPEPLLLVAGGSGVVPFRSMLRHRARTGSDVPMRLLCSSRTIDDVIYREELEMPQDGVEVVQTLTRARPPGWTGRAGRIDAALLAEVAFPPESGALAYICGSNGFVETAARALVDLGYPPQRIKTERYGGTS